MRERGTSTLIAVRWLKFGTYDDLRTYRSTAFVIGVIYSSVRSDKVRDLGFAQLQRDARRESVGVQLAIIARSFSVCSIGKAIQGEISFE